MALPNNTISTQVIKSPYLSPDNLSYDALAAYEKGGVDLQNATEGLTVRDWLLRYDNQSKSLILETTGKVYYPITNIEKPDMLDLAFDQNMNYCISYSIGSQTWLKWYDSSTLSFKTNLYNDVRNGRLCLDDKRTDSTNTSDIIFAYIKKENKSLCYRQQRDRFGTEYILQTGIPDECVLQKVGMTENLRLYFEITKQVLPPICE